MANANLYKIFLKKNFKTMDVTIGGVSLVQAIFVFIMWVGYNATRGINIKVGVLDKTTFKSVKFKQELNVLIKPNQNSLECLAQKDARRI